MASDRCGLGSLLPTSCRGRAETFARRLSNRLRSLGHAVDEEEAATAASAAPDRPASDQFWHDHPKDVASPPDAPDAADRFYDFDAAEQTSGTSSPANEVNFFILLSMLSQIGI